MTDKKVSYLDYIRTYWLYYSDIFPDSAFLSVVFTDDKPIELKNLSSYLHKTM